MSARSKLRKSIGAFTWIVSNPRLASQLASAFHSSDDNALAEALGASLPDSAMFELMRKVGVKDVSFMRNGARWRTDLGDEIGHSLWTHGGYETEEMSALTRWMKKNGRIESTIIDCGANVGTTSIPFAQLGFRVVAIEPVPQTFGLLAENVMQNGLESRIECVNVAIDLCEATVSMWTGFGSGQAEVVVDECVAGIDRWGARGKKVSVPSKPLTTILLDLEIALTDVAIVWADVQGSEGSLIRSATDLWATGVPLWLEVDPPSLELHGGLGSFLSAVRESFSAFIPREDLLNGNWARRSLDEFPGWCESIPELNYSDALLIAD